MSPQPALPAALALLVASVSAPCAAQGPAEPPMTIDVVDLGTEPRRVVPYELTAPGGTVVVSATCREQCEVPRGWWRGPGTYVFDASDWGTTVHLLLDLHGDEHDVDIELISQHSFTGSARIGRMDSVVRARFIAPGRPGDPWVVEVENPTDIALTVLGQPNVHWAIEPTEPNWSLAEREARTLDTYGGCGTGLRLVSIPAHATTHLELTWLRRTVPPGSYRGVLRASEHGVHVRHHVITFAIEVVADATTPAGVRFTAAP